MRENRLYGSEGGAAKAVPTPISIKLRIASLGFAALTASLPRPRFELSPWPFRVPSPESRVPTERTA